jgi:hypothetical protein
VQWLNQKVSGLSKTSLNKNKLQELLLGVGLFIRDLELTQFREPDEPPLPEFLINSCMVADDANSIAGVLRSLSDYVMKHGPGYVFL